jgi:hypothetical protein
VVGGFHPCRLGQAQVATLLSPFSLSLLSFFTEQALLLLLKIILYPHLSTKINGSNNISINSVTPLFMLHELSVFPNKISATLLATFHAS